MQVGEVAWWHTFLPTSLIACYSGRMATDICFCVTGVKKGDLEHCANAIKQNRARRLTQTFAVIMSHFEIKLLSGFSIPWHGRCVCRVHVSQHSVAEHECPLSLESCLTQDKKICSGRGDCRCDTCISHDNHFQGPTCELCPSYPSIFALHRYHDFL